MDAPWLARTEETLAVWYVWANMKTTYRGFLGHLLDFATMRSNGWPRHLSCRPSFSFSKASPSCTHRHRFKRKKGCSLA
eukprot:scaffold191_cov677-Pavlova_lutheri.AAC.7